MLELWNLPNLQNLPPSGRGGNVRICQFMQSIFSFLAISSFGFNRLSSKLVGMLFGIVHICVQGFCSGLNCFVA